MPLCVLLFRPAYASETPRVTINITERAVRYEVSLPVTVFDAFFPARRKDPAYIDPSERQRASVLVEKTMKERNAVTIDGIRVKPVIESVEFVPGDDGGEVPDAGLPETGIPGIPGIPGIGPAPGADKRTGPEEQEEGRQKDDRIRIVGGRVLITAVYGAMESPRTVSMVWELFPGPGSASAGKMYAGLAAFDDWQEIVFSQDEPEYVWHALERPSRQPLAVAEAPAERARVHVSVVTVLLLVATGVFLVATRRRRLPGRARAVASCLVVVIAVALVGVGRAEVELPWRPSVGRPEEAQALEMFTSLHKNIYRAFDYKTEDDVYDVLAQSVDGALLDAIYNEIYRGLILRDQGGAVCRIDTVEVVRSELTEPDDSAPRHEAAFGVKCRWRVTGSVHHWGHTHTRVNEYLAAYTVEPRGPVGSTSLPGRGGQTWKITASQVLDEKRLRDATTGDSSGGGG